MSTQWIHVKKDRSHEQIHSGSMSQNQRKIYRINEMNKLIIQKYQCHEKEWYCPMQIGKQHKRDDATIDPRSSKQNSNGKSLHHVNG
jgi:hypothetical protein